MNRLPQEVAEQLAETIQNIPGVHELHSGRFGEIAQLYPGARVAGLRTTDQGLEIHIIANFGINYQELAESIREAALETGSIPSDATVDVYISDLAESE